MKRRRKILPVFLAAAVAVSSAVPVLAENMQDMYIDGESAEEVVSDAEVIEEIEEEASSLIPTAESGNGFMVEEELDGNSQVSAICLKWLDEGKGYRWDAVTHKWYLVNLQEPEMTQPFGESGVYTLGQTQDKAPLSWNLDTSGEGATAVPGYRWNADSQTYEYYLDEADVGELDGALQAVPSIIYVGAKGDIAKHSGLREIGGKIYYLNTDGSLFKSGNKIVDGTTYCFDGNGNLTKSYKPVTPGWVKQSGKYYWRLEDGSFLKGGGWQQLGGKKYFLDEKTGARKTGWLDWQGARYYLLENGGTAAGMQKIGSAYYYFEQSGKMATGWKTINGKKYFFVKAKANMGKRASGWKTINGKQYYFQPSTGVMKTGAMKLSGKYYVLKANGVRVKKGWATVNGRTYYVNAKTKRAAIGWKTIGGKKYYFVKSANGRRASGWRTISGKKYYFKPKTGVMKTGILTLSGKKYYLGTDGKLVVNKEYLVIGKKSYRINKTGVMTELKDSEAQILAKKKLDDVGWNLRSAFNWAAGIPYVDVDNEPPAGTSFAEYNAVYGFKNSHGDCQVMAATFYYMAHALGYDVHMVRGYVPLVSGVMGPHSWCEIAIDGRDYIFDPNFTNQTGRNGYQITYGTSGTWMYTDGQRIN